MTAPTTSQHTPIQPGDIVDRPDNIGLDPRPVAAVEGDMIRLQIGGIVSEPIPAYLYRVVRRAEDTETPSGGNHRARTAVPEARAPGEEVEQPSPAAPSRPVDRVTWTGPLHVEQDVRHESWITTVALTDDANRQLARDLADRHMADLVILSRLRQQEKKLRRGRFDVAAAQAAHEAQQVEARLAGALQSTATTQWVHTPLQAERLLDDLTDSTVEPETCIVGACYGLAAIGSYCDAHREAI